MRLGLVLSLAIHGLAAAALVIWGVARAPDGPEEPMRRIAVAMQEAVEAPEPEMAVEQREELPTLPRPAEAWPVPEEEPATEDIEAPPASLGVGGDRMLPVLRLKTPLRWPAKAPAPEPKPAAAPAAASVAAPPRPAIVREPRLLPDSPPARYPERARRLGLEGTVVLLLHVAADGTVERVEVAASSGHEVLDRAAEEAAPKWRYEPALRDGMAIAYDVRQPVEYTLGGA
ncbi:MAG TPA: TonB family protein [Planctomycetota bacterium]|nr:TonB family protein [Planctomycetota bacterium]